MTSNTIPRNIIPTAPYNACLLILAGSMHATFNICGI
jgi:hypothetical protein